MQNDSAKYRFEKTIAELQAQLKVLPVGIAAAGAWKYAFIYDILPRYYPDIQDRARPISRKQAQQTLILRHLNNVVAATRSEAFKALDVLGSPHAEFDRVINSLIETGQIHEVPVEGNQGKVLVLDSAFASE